MDTPTLARHAMVDALRAHGAVVGGPVEAAMRAVPRHLFVPGVPIAKAYADDVVQTKQDPSGVSISAASQPTIVALMLEDLDVHPGHRVLEIGAGTGYNAALLAHLAGAARGRVTTIDVDEDIVDGARRGLAAAAGAGGPEQPAYAEVRVVLGDGAAGWPDGAPYDRVIATVGAGKVPRAWLDQLDPSGRLVVPLRLRGSVSRSIAFERDGDGTWSSRASRSCAFMPLRGSAGEGARLVPLTADATVTIEAHPDQEVGVLEDILDRPRLARATGVRIAPRVSFEWLWLWLACRLDNALCRLNAPPEWDLRTMVAVDGASIAYLTWDDGEVGVLARGPDAGPLADRLVAEVRAWDRDARSRRVEFRIGTTEPSSDSPPAPAEPLRFTFDNVSITWR